MDANLGGDDLIARMPHKTNSDAYHAHAMPTVSFAL
jgi:hypothetical protein